MLCRQSRPTISAPPQRRSAERTVPSRGRTGHTDLVQAQWPLIGRAVELGSLSAAVVNSDQHGVVIAGASGLGKTRLAQECLRAAEAAGLATARVTATRAARAIPFGAVRPPPPPAPAG